ncbi:hypothetical protein ACFYM2_21335 [Streptomyces sp. NPDC006711]|uniref:hypothetical protein n=1 Tax=Streptomyces sp. NPDC006711 TaxID=3364762 RepID=UPI003682ABD2
MTTATKPLPPHGTYARSVGRPAQGVRGCSCPRCCDARNSYDKRRRVMNATGRSLRVPAPPVAAHAQKILDNCGWNYLLTESGCSSCTIHRLLHGQAAIKRTVANRILAVPVDPQPGRLVPALASARRLRALLAIGHHVNGASGICAAARVDQSVISALISGRRQTLRADTEARITGAYLRLADTPGTHERNRQRAEANRWAPPAYWDPDTLEDPDFTPATGHSPRAVILGENAHELVLEQGHSWEHAANRLGVTKDSLQTAYYRWRRTLTEVA